MSAPAHLRAAAGALEYALRRLQPDRLWTVRVEREGVKPGALSGTSGESEPGTGPVSDDAVFDRDLTPSPDRSDDDGIEHRADDLIAPGRVEAVPRLAPSESD